MMFGSRNIEMRMFSPANIEMKGADWYQVEFNTLRVVPITPPRMMMFGSLNIELSIVMFTKFHIEMGGAN
jgi:nitric oxide synthase oxygenase domain/subunit